MKFSWTAFQQLAIGWCGRQLKKNILDTLKTQL